MGWWYKLLFGAIGLSLSGPLGGLIGVAIGHAHDLKRKAKSEAFRQANARRAHSQHSQRSQKRSRPGAILNEEAQLLFFITTFSVCGALANADGQVSPEERALIKEKIKEFDFIPDQYSLALKMFDYGTRPDFDLWGTVQEFKRHFPRRKTLHLILLSFLIQLALSDGVLHPKELEILQRMATLFAIPTREFKSMLAREKMTYFRTHRQKSAALQPGLANAYQVLGVTPQDSDDQIKLAYRRLMSQYHPDKLVSKGLPEELLAAATQKTQEIQTAWAQVSRARKAS
jgi:DnaJ like chaperone protein